MTDLEHFFYDMFGSKKILFRCLRKKSKPIDATGYYDKLPLDILKYANDNNFEVYFVVNNGGYSNSEIKSINSLFIDLDCGRNENKEYFPISYVENYKKNKLYQINNFPVKPSYIIETRNGYHLYWITSEVYLNEFDNLENKLVEYFDADENAKKLCQLMRVPEFDWCKDRNNRFNVNVFKSNNIKYDRSILETITGVSINDIGKRGNEEYIKDTIIAPKTPFSCTTYLNNNITYIKNKDIKSLQDILNVTPQEFYTYEERDVYLKHQDLNKFLGVYGNKFKCIFHNDTHPSAGIILSNTGDYIYNCLSSNCKFKGNIVKCTEKIIGCNRKDALKFLCNVYKIKILETEYQQERKEILKENVRYLRSDDFKIENPELYERIKNYLPLLYVVNDIAADNLPPEHYTSEQENSLFFSSIKHIANVFEQPNNYRKITDRIGLFAYLGLINKLSEKDIPKHLLNEANKKAINLKKETGLSSVNRVSFFDIPSYCCDLLQFSKQKAIEFKEKNFTMKGWSRELLLRSLGEEEANRVYPQMKNKKIPKKNEEISIKIEKKLLKLIDNKDWATEKEVLEDISYQKYYKEVQIKRILCEMLDKYNLQRVRLNKELKNKYKINIKGYPFIIIKQEEI